MARRVVHPNPGLPRRRAQAICVGWFVLGLSAILPGLLPLERMLSRRAELAALTWLSAQADALRPLVLDPTLAAANAPTAGLRAAALDAAAPGDAAAAQLWLVSALEGEPGLIVPVSVHGDRGDPVRGFDLLQAGIAAARGGVTRPLALVDSPDGRLAVAYLRLTGTRYGISMSMPAAQLYGSVRVRLAAGAAAAVSLLALACVGLYVLIVQPASARLPCPAPLVAPAPPAVPVAPSAAALRQVLYHVDLLAHDIGADPRFQEHLRELRASARQALGESGPRD